MLYCVQVAQLEAKNKELVQEMKKIKSSQRETERAHQELEKASKKLGYQKISKSKAHEELLRVQQDNEVC